MNNPNPLVPQGTTPAGGKSAVRNAVLTIVVVHVAFIGSLLFWGCSKDTSTARKDDSSVSSLTTTDATPVYPVEPNINNSSAVAGSPSGVSAPSAVPSGSVEVPPVVSSNTAAVAPIASIAPLTSSPGTTTVAPITPTTPTPVSALTPVAPSLSPSASSASEYAIAKGDTLAVVAKKHGVTLKALQEANQGVDPRKLKVGQKIQIPTAVASSPATTTSDVSGAADAPVSAESTVYTVKAGDNLVRIAKNHHTTVKAIVAHNGLKSQNNLKVGQKLKMPTPKTSTVAAPSEMPGSTTNGTAPASTPFSHTPHATTAIN